MITDWEPTFEEYLTARRVMIHVRGWLEGQGEHVSLSGCPVFAHVVMQSSPVVNPALFESAGLASAEGLFERPVAIQSCKGIRRRRGRERCARRGGAQAQRD